MKVIALCIVLSAMCAPQAVADSDTRKQKCQQAKQKIRNIQSRMRQGYNVKQGIRMDEKLRRLRKQRSKYCN